jgi:hypothetical protein
VISWFGPSHCRAHLGRLENEFADLEKLVATHELPREVLQAVRDLSRRQEGIGLSETELRERLNRFEEPWHRPRAHLAGAGAV